MKNLAFLLLALIFFSSTSAGTPYKMMAVNQGPLSTTVMIRSNLYLLQTDGTTTLLDGDMTQYEDDFSNNLDSLDIRKMTNFSENLGQIRYSSTLVVERRTTIADADTIFFKLWKTHQRAYQFQFISMNMEQPGLSAFLEDSYLQTKTPLSLNDTTSVNFSINGDAASANPYRFRIIFARIQESLLPLTITSVKAYQENSNTIIDWESENENGIKKFYIQRSFDGSEFIPIGSVNAHNLSANNYRWIDYSAGYQNLYYRIQTLEMDGKTTYSQVIRVNPNKLDKKITIFPNPVTGSEINLKMSRQPEGHYQIRLINSFGECMDIQSFNYLGKSDIKLSINKSIPKGVYHLFIIKPSAETESIDLVF